MSRSKAGATSNFGTSYADEASTSVLSDKLLYSVPKPKPKPLPLPLPPRVVLPENAKPLPLPPGYRANPPVYPSRTQKASAQGQTEGYTPPQPRSDSNPAPPGVFSYQGVTPGTAARSSPPLRFAPRPRSKEQARQVPPPLTHLYRSELPEYKLPLPAVREVAPPQVPGSRAKAKALWAPGQPGGEGTLIIQRHPSMSLVPIKLPRDARAPGWAAQ